MNRSLRVPRYLCALACLFGAAPAQAVIDGGYFTIYRYEFPPAGQQGPANRICIRMKRLEAEVSLMNEIIVEDPVLNRLVPSGPVTPGGADVPTIWMVDTETRTGVPPESPGMNQGDLQVDNWLTTSITAFAVAIPAPTADIPTLGYSDRVYTGKSEMGWQSAIVSRAQWDLNVWDDLAVGDPGNAAEEVPASPAPIDWTTAATGGAGRSFTDLFGADPDLGAVALFWTASNAYAIPPGATQLGFQIGTAGQTLSDRPLPFVTFGDGVLHAPSNLALVPEPTAAALLSLCAAAITARRKSRQA